MKTVKIGILGLGTVGSGVYELVKKNWAIIRNRSGVHIEIVKVADKDPVRKDLLGIPDQIFTKSAYEVIEDRDVDIVVELIGGTTVSKELIIKAVNNKKHVVTANKALLAEHGREILSEVLKNKVELGFEASVGGGIPIIKTLREALVGNRIEKIVGIVNGTTNFILTKMTKERIDFKTALNIAQEKGFAEADPYLDISGGDARHKIAILSFLAFNGMIDISRIYVEGIEEIDIKDIQYAWELGFVLKLLAVAERLEDGVLVKVHPALVSKENPLAAISWEDNAIMVYSDFLGKSLYSGKGAGKKPTASAVVSDITDIALRMKNTLEYNKSSYSYLKSLKQMDFERSRTRFYFRFQALDRPGILSKIAGILGNHDISIASVIQKEMDEEGEFVPLVMMTHESLEANVGKAIEEIDKISEVKGKSKLIRVIEE